MGLGFTFALVSWGNGSIIKKKNWILVRYIRIRNMDLIIVQTEMFMRRLIH